MGAQNPIFVITACAYNDVRSRNMLEVEETKVSLISRILTKRGRRGLCYHGELSSSAAVDLGRDVVNTLDLRS